MTAPIGVIGGSGFYAFLDGAQQIEVETPYGSPSDPVVVGDVGGRQVAFLPRHGADHRYPPHRIPYRANLWALRALGVRQVLAPCAVGALQPGLGPGSLVVPDQLVDRTSGRPQTFYDTGAVHVAFADPYCPTGRAVAVAEAAAQDWSVTEGGTMVVVEGPRFSTRAESRWFSAAGCDVVNMTQYPESVLARELGICYCGVALVTDYDAGLDEAEGAEPVTMDAVFAVLRENIERVQRLLTRVVGAVPSESACGCAEGFVDPGSLPV